MADQQLDTHPGIIENDEVFKTVVVYIGTVCPDWCEHPAMHACTEYRETNASRLHSGPKWRTEKATLEVHAEEFTSKPGAYETTVDVLLPSDAAAIGMSMADLRELAQAATDAADWLERWELQQSVITGKIFVGHAQVGGDS